MQFGLPLHGDSLQVGCHRQQRLFSRVDERTDGGLWRAIEEDIQARRRNVRLFIKHDDVVVQLRQLSDRFQHVLLRDAAGRVLRL